VRHNRSGLREEDQVNEVREGEILSVVVVNETRRKEEKS